MGGTFRHRLKKGTHMYQLPGMGTPERARSLWAIFEDKDGENFSDVDVMIASMKRQIAYATEDEPEMAKVGVKVYIYFLVANGFAVEGIEEEEGGTIFGPKLEASLRRLDAVRKMP